MKRDKIVKMTGSGIDGSGPRMGYITRRGLFLNVTSCLGGIRCKRPELFKIHTKQKRQKREVLTQLNISGSQCRSLCVTCQ